ncbi:hypothetical protein SEA_ZOOMAN_305 [Microbacterium phage Zooman]|nr:hypothetical protein SEA_ZOOMAN_305 [Microbacterium phage Zooman]
MATPIHPILARFAADLNDLWEKHCAEAPDEFFELFNPVSIKLYTGDGLTAEFYEEGIDFYPKKS